MPETATQSLEMMGLARRYAELAAEEKRIKREKSKLARVLKPALAMGAIAIDEDEELFLGGGFEREVTEQHFPCGVLTRALLDAGFHPEDADDLMQTDVVFIVQRRNVANGGVELTPIPPEISKAARDAGLTPLTCDRKEARAHSIRQRTRRA
jgi:hypothetical protein